MVAETEIILAEFLLYYCINYEGLHWRWLAVVRNGCMSEELANSYNVLARQITAP